MSSYRDRVAHAVEQAWPLLVPVLLLVLITLLLSGASPDIQSALMRGLIMVIVVVGLYTFTGLSGVLSAGHASFMAIGAYIGGILTIPSATRDILLPGLPDAISGFRPPAIVAALIGIGVAGVIAALLSIPLMRLDGLSAAVSTLALLIIVQTILVNWKVLSGTSGATAGVPADITIWSALAWAVIAVVIAFAFQRSRWGRRLQAAREDGVAARSIGIAIVRHRQVAFVLSAMITAAAGSLYAHFVGVLVPTDFYIGVTFLMIAMLVLGGINSLFGAVVGALAVSLITEALTRMEAGQALGPIDIELPSGVSDSVLAVVVLLFLVLRPDGLTAGREARAPRRLRRRAAAAPAREDHLEPVDSGVESP